MLDLRLLRRLAALATLLTVATLPLGAQPKPFVINVIISLTGPAANLGQDESTALTALEGYVNASGGIRGTPVHFQIADDESQPAVAVQLLQQLLQQHPAVVLGSVLTGTSQAMAGLVEANGPVLYALTPNMYPKPFGWVFASSATTRDLSGVSIPYFKARGVTKAATFLTNDASGQNNLLGLETTLAEPQNKGLTIVDKETFGVSDINADAQAARIKASGAEVVYAINNGTALGTAFHALYDVGLDVPVYTSAASFSPQLLDGYKSFLPKVLLGSGPSFYNRNRPASDPLKKPIDDFYAALTAQGVRFPIATHGFAWDPGMLVVTAFRQLGPDASAQQLHDWIERQNHVAGVEGVFDFTKDDQHGLGISGLLMLRSDPDSPGRPIVISKAGGVPLPEH